MVRLVRHRQTKGSETDRPNLNHRATPRLHSPYRSVSRFEIRSGIVRYQQLIRTTKKPPNKAGCLTQRKTAQARTGAGGGPYYLPAEIVPVQFQSELPSSLSFPVQVPEPLAPVWFPVPLTIFHVSDTVF
jgi:hypothetical protein